MSRLDTAYSKRHDLNLNNYIHYVLLLQLPYEFRIYPSLFIRNSLKLLNQKKPNEPV
ncbi:hypothetical protein NVP1238A_05 [Vibrio phage 1.238.A._10N.261.52.F10]|uniref:Uncharacterized protein n=1 Tax=Vibrio phage 1.238.A._10N.261.52.F10 TaxID=1881231 RepID=A0A2I7RUE5_9CAUD|nr:hypothetical protein KNT79_gp05 [Vibrio phage 1.238.A._10N.261.52.F10]AUR97254.1 hypothetical protein NVP1238A_05 [Vibrio phage 1.238.A._10N.261.52.F10]AUR97348.1 hypothetical protein NVP1238B_06 [Vibrio phage 1.238.B._10N.261.52.F10]